METSRIYNECNLETMARMPDEFVDMTLTSPPYDDLRVYNGYHFQYEATVPELYRVTKQGGVVVWIVGDATVDGSETGSSFRQALFFKEVGFRIHDTMIWQKTNPMPMDSRIPRYLQAFEYMFIFSKEKPKTCNHLRDECKKVGVSAHNNYPARRENGAKSNERVISKTPAVKPTRVRYNIWPLPVNGATDKLAKLHPATFPEKLARDHITSWSNEGDIIYDPFAGSGTTLKMAEALNRRWIGSEISEEYVQLAHQRLSTLKA
jgi:site-specific DNA-methyltransferase (adenine-specific)